MKQKSTVNKNKIQSSNLKMNKKIIRIILVIILILALMLLCIYIFNMMKYKKYIKYEEKMNIYGFSNIYDNHSAKTKEKITKLEALKMVISAINNYSDFNSFFFYPDEQTDEDFLEIIKKQGLTEDVNEYNMQIKYVELLEYFANAKKNYLKLNLTDSDKLEIKSISKYTLEKQIAIKDIILNKIVERPKNKLPLEQYVFKGMLNELVVNFVEKYGTILPEGEKLNVNPAKMPSNANEYPYILASVDKSVYELKNKFVDEYDYANAATLYKEEKESYKYIEEILDKYLTTILNVDYTNLDEEKFKETVRSVSLFDVPEMDFRDYFSHVKKNKIQISGTSKLQFPAIYFDGFVYRARTKIEINIKNALEPINLIFRDIGQIEDVKYEKDNIIQIIDMPISKYFNTLQFAVYVNPLTPIPHYSTNPDELEDEEVILE